MIIRSNKIKKLNLTKNFKDYSNSEFKMLNEYLNNIENKFNIQFRYAKVISFSCGVNNISSEYRRIIFPNEHPTNNHVVKNIKDILKTLSEKYPSKINANIFKQLNI